MNEKYECLPEHMQDGARGYIEHGWEPGTFLRLILENDFAHAAGHADFQNRHALIDWAYFLVNMIPAIAWGSSENVNAWIRYRRAEAESLKEKIE